MTLLASTRLAIWALSAALPLAFVGCAEPPKPPPVVVPVGEQPFEQAVATAADALIAQTQALPAFAPKAGRHAVVIDPMLDAGTGQQTAATQLLQQRVVERIGARRRSSTSSRSRPPALTTAQYLLTGTMTLIPADRPDPVRRINIALTDLKSGLVVAQATALARPEGLDHTPLPYYRDSPVLLKDEVLEGYIRTSATRAGGAADKFYLDRVSVATLIEQATNAYNGERYQDALAGYRSANGTSAGDQLRALNGIYLSSIKLGRAAEAEQAFGKVVAYGIQYNELGVKFLFNPGTTEFWSDPKVSGPYPMWLRQIAREAGAAKVCMNIVGHTSHTGSEAINDALSLRRASAIRQRLGSDAAALLPRTQASGVGFRENIVGSGTDNAVDALDRRVEFKIVPCG